MQNVGASLIALFRSATRDLVNVYEFYPPSATELVPANASKLFSTTNLTHNGYEYERQAIARGDITRYFDGKFNSVSVTLSNVDDTVGAWLASTSIEGYKLVIRAVSRSITNDSAVLMVGRCEAQYDVDSRRAVIQCTQYVGNIYSSLPFNLISQTCQVKGGFKAAECLGGVALGSKPAAYQAATSCNFSGADCSARENKDLFQGVEVNTTSGNFKLKQPGKFLPSKVTKKWSAATDAPYGKYSPLGFGRTQIVTIPIVHADTGQYIAGQSFIGDGPVAQIVEVKCASSGFEPTFQALATHRGEFGNDPEQDPAGFFTSSGYKHSHRAYIEYTIKGTNADTGDPAPTIVATVLWLIIPVWDGTDFTTEAWSDNGVEVARFLLADHRSLNIGADFLDDAVVGESAAYVGGAVKDVSKGEQLYLENSLNGIAGTDALRRYRSTGLLDTEYYRYQLGLTATNPGAQETDYNYFDVLAPPDQPDIIATTNYRKRYTCNVHITDKVKTVDFIWNTLLPSFMGYIVTSAQGKLQIKVERPALTMYLRSSAAAGATALQIEDVEPWDALDVPAIFGVVGVGLTTAETFEVVSTDFSTAGNSIGILKSTTGGITATLSGATFSGGSVSTPATATITFGGTPGAGDTVQISIDILLSVSYTLNASDTTGTVAATIANALNTHASISRYVRASWDAGTPTVATLTAKYGTLNLAAPLEEAHDVAEEIMNVAMPFSSHAAGANARGNILKGSFRYPLNNREPVYNKFTIKYQDALLDYQEVELNENDYTHQALINAEKAKEIPGDCVDNYHQANRLVVAARYKYGPGKEFYQLSGTGLALLLEEGDVIAVHHSKMPGRYHQPARIEELKVTPEFKVKIVARKYNKNQYPDSAAVRTVPLTTSVVWPTSAPGTPASLALTNPSAGTLRGEFTFSDYVGEQLARVEIKKAGAGSFVDSGLRIKPDSSMKGSFEIAGLPGGTTEVNVYAFGSNQIDSAVLNGSIAIVGFNGYTHTQASPSTTWTINHNLGYYPRVVAFDTGGAEIDGAVTNPTVNQTVINFTTATAGTARLS